MVTVLVGGSSGGRFSRGVGFRLRWGGVWSVDTNMMVAGFLFQRNHICEIKGGHFALTRLA